MQKTRINKKITLLKKGDVMRKANIFILIIVVVTLFVANEYTYAGNACRMLGFGPRDDAMAGATTASSEDTSCLVRNPAGLVRIGNKIDLSYENIFFHDVTIDPEGSGKGAKGYVYQSGIPGEGLEGFIQAPGGGRNAEHYQESGSWSTGFRRY